MKILVAVKRVADPDNLNKIKITPEGGVDATGLEPKASPYDEYALEAALRLTENGANPKARLGEVVVVTLGPKAVEPMLRAMLATGADRAVRVEATDEQLDGDVVARALAALVQREKPDLVLVGYQQVEHESNEVGQRLAGHLGWPQATFVGGIESEKDTALVVRREIEGATAELRVGLPAVVTVLDKIIHPQSVRSVHTAKEHLYPDGVRFAALMAIMAAKKKPLAEMALKDLTDARPKVRYLRVQAPAKRGAGVRVKDAKELVMRLKTEAKVL